MVLGLGEVTGSDSFINIFNFKICVGIQLLSGFPGGSDDKESACSAGDRGSIPGSRRSPGEGNGSPLQSSFMERPTDRGVWWSDTRSDLTLPYVLVSAE